MSQAISTTQTTSAASTAQTGDLFTPLLLGIRLFRARVEGTDGDQRARLLAMPADPALVPDVVRAVLDTLAKALRMLGDALDTIEKHLIGADALLALLEAAGAAITAMGNILSQDFPPALGRAEEAGEVLVGIGTLIENVSVDLPPIVPRVETLLDIQTEIHLLIGTEAEPGSLTLLIQALGTQA